VNYSEIRSKKRVAVLLFAAIILFGGLIIRVCYLQVFKAGWLKKSAEEQRFRVLTVLPRRGTIYDRLGNELAISVDGDSVYAIPAEIGFENRHFSKNLTKAQKRILMDQDRTKIAKIVANILAMDPDRVKRLFTSGASFVWIKRKASIDEVNNLRLRINDKENRIHGIEIVQKAQRFYPQSSLASQILGIAGIDNQGLEGLEKQYDHYLRGVPGSDQAEFDTTNHHIPQGERRYLAPVDGDSLTLTIDQNLQYIVERELDKAIVDTKCKRAMAIVVDPQTGEVLAAASRPSYDANHFGEFPVENRRNPIFTDMYEPGSSFKIFTSVAALEEGQVTPDSKFFDPGFIIIDGRAVRCWKPGGHGSQTFVEALENSCNPVFAAIALRLTKESFYNYIKAFGFGSRTGVDFPGESGGRLQRLDKVKNMELANIGFGQGISVTPIQMAMGVSAVANGGYLLKPQIIKEITSVDGRVKFKFERQVIRQVISGKTAVLMNKLLQQVVTNGSGIRAYLEGYRVAGKTATAQKVAPGERGYSGNKVISSFIGYAPAENPRILTLVIIDEPGVPVRFGSVIAAPVVGSIFKDGLRYLGVKPNYEPEVMAKITSEEVIVPNIRNMPIDQALAILRSKQIGYRLIGNGSYVFDQVPKSGVTIKKNSKVIIYFYPEEQYQSKGMHSRVVLPNFQGLSLRKVNQLLTEMGLQLEAKGTGVAVGQEPPPGTILERGTIVNVTFTPKLDNLP
jgi:stage V sporulation protein D (sporulation-specific penicillin-binding protein)